jgi:hypothetical protein
MTAICAPDRRRQRDTDWADCSREAEAALAVVDGRKLHFEIEVRAGDRVIGRGRHERRAV